MFKYESNSDQVFAKHLQKLNELGDKDKILREVVSDSLAAVTTRVQQRGEKADGSPMGNYSKVYAKRRLKEGRQASVVDLTFEGDLFRNFIMTGIRKNEYAIGFDSKTQADKAAYLEDRYGKIFYLSADEKDFALAQIKQKVSQLINEK